jgi:hypothetical protein
MQLPDLRKEFVWRNEPYQESDIQCDDLPFSGPSAAPSRISSTLFAVPWLPSCLTSGTGAHILQHRYVEP